MGVTAYEFEKGTVRIHDNLESGTPEWEERKERWKKACVRFWIAKEKEEARK